VVRFSGLNSSPIHHAASNLWQRYVNFSIPTFQKISEIFIWGFLAQDVVAMWLPRIYALLTEGRKKYDPQNDPKVRNKPFAIQFKKYYVENLKGLNWANFSEGTKREFATGPGLLIVPAVLYAVASRMMNSSIKLSFKAAKGIGKGLAEHTTHKPEQPYPEQVQQYLKRIFQDPGLSRIKGNELETWSRQWAENLLQKRSSQQKETTRILSDKLQSIIHGFNTKHRMNPYSLTPHEAASGTEAFAKEVMKDAHPLHHQGSTWISYEPDRLLENLKEGNRKGAAKRLQQMAVPDLLKDLTRMDGLVKEVDKKFPEGTSLPELTRQVTEKLVINKGWMSIAATTITAAYLTKLAFWAQSHNTYQATRFLNEKTAQNQDGRKPAKRTQSQAATLPQSTQPTAGSAYGLQPAFSSLPSSLAGPVPFSGPGGET